MSEYITIARPYAKAIFCIAKKYNSLSDWDNFLSFLSIVVSDSSVASIIKNRTINYNDKSEIIVDFFKSNTTFDKDSCNFFYNFINNLAYHGRLLCIKDIYFLYKQYMNLELGCIDAIVKIPCVISSDQKDDIINCLSKRFNKKVSALFEVDERLLGGFLVKIGDFVLDASIAGNLSSLSTKIML